MATQLITSYLAENGKYNSLNYGLQITWYLRINFEYKSAAEHFNDDQYHFKTLKYLSFLIVKTAIIHSIGFKEHNCEITAEQANCGCRLCNGNALMPTRFSHMIGDVFLRLWSLLKDHYIVIIFA